MAFHKTFVGDSPFEMGFHFALQLRRWGMTWESISHHENYDASAYGRGMFAAVEAMSGWVDVAEREARAWGFSREAAAALVNTAKADNV